MIANGVVRLLSNSMRVENTTLPRSIRPIRFVEEIILLLWRMVSQSSKFACYIIDHPKAAKLLQALAFHLHKSKADPNRANVLYLTIFILFYLSQCKLLSDIQLTRSGV